jgi:hypothetical protein
VAAESAIGPFRGLKWTYPAQPHRVGSFIASRARSMLTWLTRLMHPPPPRETGSSSLTIYGDFWEEKGSQATNSGGGTKQKTNTGSCLSLISTSFEFQVSRRHLIAGCGRRGERGGARGVQKAKYRAENEVDLRCSGAWERGIQAQDIHMHVNMSITNHYCFAFRIERKR